MLTLNLAHGRGRAATQSAARSPEYFRRNLDTIALVLQREAADVVALQEAELGSRWAGDFDHVAYLARNARYPHLVAHAHVEAPGRWRYGTAILSRRPLLSASGGAFAAQARWRKGWSAVAVEMSGAPLDIVTAHLDFSSADVRLRQASELGTWLAPRAAPRVVMGDFNAEPADAPVEHLCMAAGLRPSAAPGATLRGSRRHIDAILASVQLRVLDAVVLDDRVSDHRPVVADLTLR